MPEKKRVHIGGEGEEWSFWFTVSSHGEQSRRFCSWGLDFRAKNDTTAKEKVLEILKRKLARLKSMRGRILMGMASPYLIVCGEKRGGDGNRMVRVRFSYSCSKKMLRVHNPDLVLVQGYGHEALEKLHK